MRPPLPFPCPSAAQLRPATRKRAILAGLISGAALVPAAHALTLTVDTPASDYRFISPGTGTAYAYPVANTDPSFVGLGYDFSAVGASGWGTTGGRLMNVAMISPINIEGAWHYHFHPAAQIDFYNGQTSARERGTVAAANDALGDVAIDTLTQSFAATDNIHIARVLDISSGNYVGQPVFIFGTHIDASSGVSTGTEQIATTHVSGVSSGLISVSSRTGDTYSYSESGDSGSPLLIPYKGQLTLAGSTYFADGTSSTLIASAGSDPVTPTNAVLARDGYAVRFTIYDVPADTANTANVWTGGAGTGAFGTAANWSKGLVPVNLPVVFDSGSVGATSISLTADRTLRGLLFRAPTGTSAGGFVFPAGSTLTVGTSGIRNEDTSTQTFNAAIALGGSQNWEAANGNLLFNGNIANNGNLLVVQGAQNTTIGGILSGAGGLAKDETGTLTLGALNTYTGTTFLHNGTLQLGVANALPTGTSLRFDAANPAVLDLHGQSQTVGDVRSVYPGAGTIATNGGTLITGGDHLATTYAGAFSGGGPVTKTGLGTWTLTGSSSAYSGLFTVAAGNLQIANASGSATGSATVVINSGARLSGGGTVGGAVSLNPGGFLAPGVAGVGVLSTINGVTWNGGGDLFVTVGASGGGSLLNLGSSALTKGSGGNYAVTFVNSGGLVPGIYTLAVYGTTNFSAADFSFTNGDGFAGNFIMGSRLLQFRVTDAGNQPAQGGWNNLPLNTNSTSAETLPPLAAYEAVGNWKYAAINSVLTESLPNFYQTVTFAASRTFPGPLVVNSDSLTSSSVTGFGWYFLSQTATATTLTLAGDVSVNNLYNRLSAAAPAAGTSGSLGTRVILGSNFSVAGGFSLAAIDLGGAARTITTNLPGDMGGSAGYGFFLDAPVTDSANSGAGLTKAGPGNLLLGSAHTYTGDFNIKGGTVTLIDLATIASTNINISGGSELFIDGFSRDIGNTSRNIINNRLVASGLKIRMSGGEISFAGGAATGFTGAGGSPETQSLGALSTLQGVAVLQPFASGAGSDNATLAITALSRSSGSALLLPGLTAGAVATNGNYVRATTINGAAPVGGAILPWAYTATAGSNTSGFGFTGFAVYDSTNGFQPISATTDVNYAAAATLVGVSPATDAQLTATSALTAGAAVNSLTLSANVTLTSTGGPYTVTVGSGGVLLLGAATFGSSTAAANVVLDFNNQEATLATANSQVTVWSTPQHAAGLTLTGSPNGGSFWLEAANPYNADNSKTLNNWGSTWINSGRLVLQNGGALPNTGDVTINVSTGGVNPANGLVTSVPAALDLYGNSVTIGALNGAGTVALTSLITGKYPTGAVAGSLTVGNGGSSGGFAGTLQNSLLPVLPYGAFQGNQLLTYGATAGNVATLGLTKTGSGTETLGGLNTYTGPTLVTGGILALAGAGTLGVNSAVTLSGSAALDVSGSSVTPSAGSLAGGGATSLALGARTLAVGSNDTLSTFAGTVTGTGGGLLKTGAGTFTFSGVNRATGSLTSNQGILRLDHAGGAAPMLSATSPLMLGGGALQIAGNLLSPVTETAGGLLANAGASQLQVFGYPGQNTTVAVGAITRRIGATVDFLASGSASRISTTTPGGSILGGWATVNGQSDWAAVSAGAIVAASSVNGVETLLPSAASWGTSGANAVSDSGGFSGTTLSGSTINSLLFRGAHASSISIADTLTVASGGILVASSVGAGSSTISGGLLATGNSTDLIVIQQNTAAPLTITSTILGSAGLTKSGQGTLVLGGNDAHLGATNVNAGTVMLSGSAILGANSLLTLAPSAVVDLSGSSAAQSFASLSGAGNLVLGPAGASIGGDQSSSTFAGSIGGTTGGGITKNGAGSLTLAGLNTWRGPLTINGGTVAVAGNGTLGVGSAVTVNFADSAPAVLDLSGAATAVPIGSLTGSGNVILSPVGLTLGTSNSSTVFAGDLAGIGGFSKVGAGTLALTGTNFSAPDLQYGVMTSGGETVNGGTLLLDYTVNATSKLQTTGYLGVGGGTVSAVGHPTTAFTQNNGSLFVVSPGASAVNVSTPAGGTASFTISLNSFSRVAGGTVDFTASSGGGGGVASILVRYTLTNGLISGYTTVNGLSDWAYDIPSGSVTALPVPSVQTASASVVNTYTASSNSGSAYLTVSSNAGLVIGQGVLGTGVPAGATIVGVFGTTIQMSANATATGTGVSVTFDGITVPNTAPLFVGEGLAGANIPASATIAAIAGNVISLTAAPTGAVTSLATQGYSLGSANDQGVAVATLDDPGNWTIANYGANLGKANLTDDGAGFSGTVAVSTTINSLRLNASAAAGLGIVAGSALTLTSGGLLETAAVGAHEVTIAGPGNLTSGNSADLIVLQNNSAGGLTIAAPITGSIGLTKSGAGLLTLGGANTYTGATTVNSGTLALSGNSLLGSNSAVTVMPGATLDLSGSTLATQTFGSLSSISSGGGAGGGRVILGAATTTLAVGGNNTSTVFLGTIQNAAGGAGLAKSGTGVLGIGGALSYTGVTQINAGAILLLPGGSIAGNVTVGNGSAVATLAGSGTVGDVAVDGTSITKFGVLEPGTPLLGPYSLSTAGLLSTGNLSLSGPNAHVAFLLGGPALPGGSYSTIAVNGNLTLAGATLDLVGLSGFGPGTFRLFSYTGAESGALTLGALPNGYSASQFSLTYANGEVDLLTAAPLIAVPEPATGAGLMMGGLVLLAGCSRRRGVSYGMRLHSAQAATKLLGAG